MDVIMTPEERAEMEVAAENGDAAAQEALKSSTSSTDAVAANAQTAPTTPLPATTAARPTNETSANTSIAHHSTFASSPSGSSTEVNKKDSQAARDKKAKPKLTPEQRAQLDALEKKKDEEKRARLVKNITVDIADGGRVEALREKLIQRIRPFVEAKHPGDINDSETKAFEARIRTEAEDLKLESFGIEVNSSSSRFC